MSNLLKSNIMKAFRHFSILVVLCSLFMAAVAHSATSNIRIEEVFGRLNFSAMFFTLGRMSAMGYDKYDKMLGNHHSDSEIKTAMMQDFIKKYHEKDKDFCLNLLESMIMGCAGHADGRHAEYVTMFKEELFGNQVQPKSKSAKKKK